MFCLFEMSKATRLPEEQKITTAQASRKRPEAAAYKRSHMFRMSKATRLPEEQKITTAAEEKKQ